MNNLIQQAVHFHQSKNWPEAKRIYSYLLKLDPKNFDALLLSGLMEAEIGHSEDAIAYLSKAVKVNNQSEAALYNLATAYSKQKKFVEAERFYRQALIINPKNIMALQELGAIHMRKTQLQAAFDFYKRALDLDPNNPKTLSDIGESQRRLGFLGDAIEVLEKSLSLEPNNADTLNRFGNALYQLGKLESAKVAFENALKINPAMSDAYISLGNIFRDMEMSIDAMLAYDKALACDQNSVVAMVNRGQLWTAAAQHQEALKAFKGACEINPDFKNLSGAILNIKLNLCDWSEFNGDLKALHSKIQQDKPVLEPFVSHAIFDSLKIQRKAAEIYYRERFGLIKQQGKATINVPSPKNKIVVAYLSADFRSHPISFLMAELFEIHDRSQFEIIGISFSSVKDEMQERVSSAFDSYIQAHNKSDQEVVDIMSKMGVDIAIDLGGYTQNSRFGVFARRAAPIQMSYLGYLGTTGSDCIDYIIADDEIIPAESQKYYSEKIAYLPSYQVNDSKRSISERIFTKEELGIPKDAFVYCCFNNNYKILPDVFASWMRILEKVPNSVLFLYVQNHDAQENLKQEALKRGIDTARLIFGGRLSPAEYLARYRAADLFLDTFPYNAGTTASDSLWAGVPVLTRQGETFSSRVASSLLKAIGLPELITKTVDEYEELACTLAKAPGRLNEIKEKLSSNRQKTPLFDAKGFAHNLERLFTEAYEQSKSGKVLENIYID